MKYLKVVYLISLTLPLKVMAMDQGVLENDLSFTPKGTKSGYHIKEVKNNENMNTRQESLRKRRFQQGDPNGNNKENFYKRQKITSREGKLGKK